MLRSKLVVPDVPPVSTAPGTYKVRAEKSSPFNGKFWIVLEVNVLSSVALSVFRIGAAADTFTVVDALPTVNFTLKVGVCKTSSVKGGMVAVVNPFAFTVTW